MRPGIMLVLAMLLVACAGAPARAFNVTYFFVPQLVTPDQQEVTIECRYDANFTVLNWFKGTTEFFRYEPGTVPSIRTFSILGVGTVEMVECGPEACQLKLIGLTKEASGLYRCDIESDEPPYMFATMEGRMEVQSHLQWKPLLKGLAEEYKEGDMIQAYCRGSPDSELRWYINGAEIEEFRGSTNLRKKNNRSLYKGVPLTMEVQCVEFRYAKAYGSILQSVKWSDGCETRKKKEGSVTNGSITITGHLGLLSILCLLDKVIYV